jgi:hypothetical protein
MRTMTMCKIKLLDRIIKALCSSPDAFPFEDLGRRFVFGRGESHLKGDARYCYSWAVSDRSHLREMIFDLEGCSLIDRGPPSTACLWPPPWLSCCQCSVPSSITSHLTSLSGWTRDDRSDSARRCRPTTTAWKGAPDDADAFEFRTWSRSWGLEAVHL